MADIISRFYVRLIAEDQPGVSRQAGAVLWRPRSQPGVGGGNSACESHRAEIVVVSHEVPEANCQKALDELREFSEIHSVASVLRVL